VSLYVPCPCPVYACHWATRISLCVLPSHGQGHCGSPLSVCICLSQGRPFLTVSCCHRDKVTVGPRLSELLDGLLEPLAEDRLNPQEAIDIITGVTQECDPGV
jgi:hypothetical protein